MSKSSFPSLRMRPRKGAVSMEHVFGGALAAVIVAAVVLTVWQTMFTGPGGGQRAGNPRYQCLLDGETFEVEEVPRAAIREAPDPTLALLDCPNGHERAAVQMQKCVNPDCERWFIPQTRLYRILQFTTDLPDEVAEAAEAKLRELLEETDQPLEGEPRDICPYCQTDQLEYVREQRGR